MGSTRKLDVVVMSSKGQVVVPQGIRHAVDADAGTQFFVYGQDDSIVFKKIEMPSFSKKEFQGIVASNERRLKASGFATSKTVNDLVNEAVAAVRKPK